MLIIVGQLFLLLGADLSLLHSSTTATWNDSGRNIVQACAFNLLVGHLIKINAFNGFYFYFWTGLLNRLSVFEKEE